MSTFGITGPIRAVVLGARGGVGAAFVQAILDSCPSSAVVATSRDPDWVAAGSGTHRCGRHLLDVTDEAQLAALAGRLFGDGWQPNVILNAVGILHDGALQPERSWRHLSAEHLHRVFSVNAVGVALVVKHLVPLLPREGRAVFGSLSARIGSIGDNRLGGWYSYRASKAAHNMIVKTAAIEARRRRPELVMASLHPGTVDSALSEPFQKSVPPHKLFTPAHAAQQLIDVLGSLTPQDSGNHYAYDGSRIEW